LCKRDVVGAMAHRALTDRFCQAAKAVEGQTQTDYWDADCKGLALRVSRSGAKTWSYVFGWGNGRVRMKLGTYPATSLARAHTLADEVRADLEAGHDPRAAPTPETLRAICEEYLGREAGNLRSGEDRKATLERLVYPTLGDRPIGDIRRSEIVRLLDTVEDERGPAAADKTLAFIRRVFNWYATRSDDFRTPIVRGMARTKPHERARARMLTDDEIRTVWAAAAGQGAFGRLVQFLLLTGARRSEAAAMPWSELDGGDWTLPGERNKTKLDLVRPLSEAALAVLGPKPDGATPDTFIYSTDSGATAISGFSKLKAEFDKAAPIAPWRLHDLRRTARSLMSRAGVPSDHAERVLGHVIDGVRGTYDRHQYLDEKRVALEKLARQVDFIVHRRIISVKLVRLNREAEVITTE
jgi:integrase